MLFAAIEHLLTLCLFSVQGAGGRRRNSDHLFGTEWAFQCVNLLTLLFAE
jgi:hypothetical protein